MMQVQNNTGITAAATAAMSDQVLKLSDTFGVSADTIAAGYAHVVNITRDAAGATGIMSVALESAASTGADAAQVANVLTNAMHEYGLDAVKAADGTTDVAAVTDNAAHVMGIFHIAAQDANMSLQQFADVSGQAVGIAASMNIPLEDVSSSIADLTKHGFDAAGAGVQVKDMLTHLIKPTSDATAEFERLSKASGVDLVGDLKLLTSGGEGFVTFIDQLHQAYTNAGLSEAEFETETFKLVAAQRGGLGMNALLTTGYKDLHDILGDVSDQERVNTVTEDGWTASKATAGTQWNILSQQVANFGIIMGSQLLPVITPIIHALNDELPGALTTVRGALTVAAGNIGTFGSQLRDNISTALQGVADKLAATGAAWAPWAAQAGPAGIAVQQSLIGVSGVVQALQLLLQGNFQGAWNTAAQAMDNFVQAGGALKQVLTDNLPLIESVAAGLGTFLVLTTVVPAIIGAVEAIAAFSAGIAAWIAVMGPVEGTLGAIVAILGGPLTVAIAGVALAIGVLTLAWINNWGDIQDKVETAAGAIGSAVQGLIDWFGQLGTALVQRGVVDDLVSAWNDLSTAVALLAGMVQDLIPPLTDVNGAMSGGPGAADQSAANAADAIKSLTTDIKDFSDTILEVVQAMVAMGSALNAVQSAVADNSVAVHNAIASALDATVSDVSSAVSSMSGSFDGLNAAVDAVGSAFSAMGSAISGALSTALTAVTGWISTVEAAFQGMVGALGAAGSAAGHAAVDGLIGAINGGINSVKGAAAALANSALASAKAALGASSPSKEFEILGQSVVDGLDLGILENTPQAVATTQQMANSVLGAMSTFTASIDTEVQATTTKLADIATAAGNAITTALNTESAAIDAAARRASDSISKLVGSASITADTSGRTSALQAQIAAETAAHNTIAAADEAEYQHKLQLSNAAAKLAVDLGNATTAAQRTSLQQQYDAQVQNLNQSYAAQQAATAHTQVLDKAAADFKAGEDAKMALLTQQLADEAMGRQIADTIKTQVATSLAAQQTYQDAVQKAQLTADTQRQILLKSYDQRIADLKTAFLDKIPPLEGPALDAFNTFMDGIAGATDTMATKIADSLGTVTVAAQQTLGDVSGGGDVPDAIAVTDQAVINLANQFHISLGDAQRTLQAGATAAKEQLGTGGVIPTAAKQAADSLDQVKTAAGPTLESTLKNLETAAQGLGVHGFAVAHDAAVDLETQFPGLTAAVDAWIATLGKIPTSITTNVGVAFSSTGSPGGGGASGGGGGGGSGSRNLGSTAGTPGSFTLPNIQTGGQITVQAANLGDAINKAAAQTGVSAAAQAGGGTFGGNTNPGLAFAEGGFVPGPVGAPVLATVHGGEYVLPASAFGGSTASGSDIDYDKLADKVAEAMVRAMNKNGSFAVGVDQVHSAFLQKQHRTGSLGLT